jgi:hypothetical protein
MRPGVHGDVRSAMTDGERFRAVLGDLALGLGGGGLLYLLLA